MSPRILALSSSSMSRFSSRRSLRPSWLARLSEEDSAGSSGIEGGCGEGGFWFFWRALRRRARRDCERVGLGLGVEGEEDLVVVVEEGEGDVGGGSLVGVGVDIGFVVAREGR